VPLADEPSRPKKREPVEADEEGRVPAEEPLVPRVALELPNRVQSDEEERADDEPLVPRDAVEPLPNLVHCEEGRVADELPVPRDAVELLPK
jgi:hypothetical protein